MPDMVTLCWKHYREVKDRSAIIGYKYENGKLVRYVKEYVV